jgi:hypothetical protein
MHKYFQSLHILYNLTFPAHNLFIALTRSSDFAIQILKRGKSVNGILLQYFRGSVSRDSSVGIATGYGLDDQGAGVRVPVG